MMTKMNKRGFVFPVLIFVIIALIFVYILLYLPIPAFAQIKGIIHYLMIVIVWFVLQIGIIYGYYKVGVLAVRGFRIYKNKLQLWTFNVKSFLFTHR
jgi:amino acid transporter